MTPRLTPDAAHTIRLWLAGVEEILAENDLPALELEVRGLASFLDGLLHPPDPYADRGLRPGLNVCTGNHTASVAVPTKSTGDPVFDPTLPKDAA